MTTLPKFSRAASRSCPLPASEKGTSRSTMGLNTPCSTSLKISTRFPPNRSTSPHRLPQVDAEDAAVVADQGDRQEDWHPNDRPDCREEVAARPVLITCTEHH